MIQHVPIPSLCIEASLRLVREQESEIAPAASGAVRGGGEGRYARRAGRRPRVQPSSSTSSIFEAVMIFWPSSSLTVPVASTVSVVLQIFGWKSLATWFLAR